MIAEKIFCIGFNKTGTKSLVAIFRDQLCLKTTHSHQWTLWTHSGDRSQLAEFQAFADGECANLAQLDAMFPGSKFILNTRPLSSWLKSRHKSTERSRFTIAWFFRRFIPIKILERFICWLFLDNSEHAMKRWVQIRNSYTQHVFSYFEGREDLLVVDFESDQDKALTEIQTFLGLEQPLVATRENTLGQGTRVGRIFAILNGNPDFSSSEEAVDQFLEINQLQDYAHSCYVIPNPDWQLPPNTMDRLLTIAPFLSSIQQKLLRKACHLRQKWKSYPGRFMADRLILATRCQKHTAQFVPINRNAAGSK